MQDLFDLDPILIQVSQELLLFLIVGEAVLNILKLEGQD